MTFDESLQMSENHEKKLLEYYKQKFPDMSCIMKTASENSQVQRLGVDRIVVLKNGNTIKVDEKIRGKFRKDILLEFVKNDNTNARGWIEEELQCDYILYCFTIDQERGFFLPFHELQNAWIRNKEKWIKKYGVIRGKNQNYNSLNCAVPTRILFHEMQRTQFVFE